MFTSITVKNSHATLIGLIPIVEAESEKVRKREIERKKKGKKGTEGFA